MISLKIDVTKIDRNLLFKGAKGTYMDCVLRDKPTEYDDGYIVQSVSKEKREAGEKGPVIGGWRYLQTKPKPVPPQERKADETLDDIFGP